MRVPEYVRLFRKNMLVKDGVSTDLEMSKIMQSAPRRPFLFTNENRMRVVGNLWATRDRIAKGLNMRKKDVIPSLLSAIDNPEPYEMVEHGNFRRKLSGLDDIPVLKFFEEDGGRYLTSAILSTVWDGKHNMAYHRMLVRDGHLVARLVEGRHTDRMYHEALEHGEELKVVIFVGAPLEVMISAAVSVGYGQSELEIASALHSISNGAPLDVTEVGDIPVPADAEYVIVGRLTDRVEEEGPFVDITGTLDHTRMQPVIELDAVYSAPDPMYHTILPGAYEHFFMMGMPREATIYREVSKVADVNDIALTPGGSSWLHGAVSIHKKSEDEPKKVIDAAFKGHRSMKRVVVVDDDIDVNDPKDVEWALATRFQANRDMVVRNERGSSLDPSIYDDGTMDKWGLDATAPLGKEGFKRVMKLKD